jgi:hypothetical protein
MSSTTALFASALALSLAACVSPTERFEAFEERVVDAGQVVNTCAMARERRIGPARAIADISGEHLLAIAVSFAPSAPLQFRCSTSLAMDGAEGTLDLSCLPLLVDDDDTPEDERAPVGEALAQDNILVMADGTFCATIVGTVPGDANPISGADIVTDENGLELSGTITDADQFCGTLEGMINQPFVSEINGTFGAVRVTPGAIGEDLPAPVSDCP